MDPLYTSKLIAYAVQIVSIIIVIYAFLQPLPTEHAPLKQSLGLETVVQIIQIAVYTWLITHFHLASMASIRYLDWILTTPLLLTAFVIYLNYEAKETSQTAKTFLQENKNDLYILLLANGFMLLFGFLGELGYISKEFATIIGCLALAIVLYIIYNKYASKSRIGTTVFIPFAFIWSMYGVAYNFGEVNKNVMYNILDTLAKNVFGLFLSYKVLSIQ